MGGPLLVTGGGQDRLTAAVALHGEVFKTDPVIQYFICTMSPSKREFYTPKFMKTLLTAGALNGAVFDEVWVEDKSDNPRDPPACSAVWLPPECRPDNTWTLIPAGFLGLAWAVGLLGLKRILWDFQASSDKVKKKHLVRADGTKIKTYHYMYFLSTAVEQRKKGLSTKVVRAFQEKATNEGLPIWLESTTERSHRLYLQLGFKDKESWVIGKGKVNENGIKEKVGNGVRVWAMLWEPET